MDLHLGSNHLGSTVQSYRPDLTPYESIYRDVHQHPELSCKESRTASIVAEHLRLLDYTTHGGIGGYGVVGVLKNGDGPVVMLRSELDALPLEEQTNLDFASTRRMMDQFDIERPVMHACGHDMHLTCLLAASELLRSAQSCWHGTLIVLFQPNEEHTGGAQAMLEDGLYEKVPIPDLVLGQHSVPLKTGTVNIRAGPILTAADTVTIRINVTSSHTVNPQHGLNPIDLAAAIIVKLPSLVEPFISAEKFASVSCNEIHAGQPGLDTVQLVEIVLDIKSYEPSIRQTLHQSVRDLVESECTLAGVEQKPHIALKVRAPLTSNSPELVERIESNFKTYFKENVGEGERRRPCEDFSLLATSQGRPYAYWFFGTVDTETWETNCTNDTAFENIPGNHSPFHAPTIQPTLLTGTDAMALAALTFLT